jgi:polysaccharide biosynthesis transport protein
MADQNLEWNDIKSFIRRRSRTFVLVFLLLFFSSIIIAFTLPSIYRGVTTLFIEEQQIPENFVGAPITTYAEDRLSNIRQQIFSNDRLQGIIEKFDLYPDIREKHGMGEAIRKLRLSIGMETESAEFINPRTGKTMAATIAFILYYEGRDPETVQKVTNQLSELFLEEDIRIKEKRTTATTGFLSMELQALKEQLQLYDDKISEYKQKHLGELPEHTGVNLASLGRLERELERVNMQIRDLQDRKIIIEGQMVNVDPLLPINIDGENVARNPAERLKYLRLNLLSLQSVLHDKHPDIVKAKREIKELENQIGGAGGTQVELKRLNSLKTELAAAEGRYGSNHPDVVRLNKEIQTLEKSISSKTSSNEVRSNLSKQDPDNPVYINLITQISSIDSSIANLMSDKQSIQQELNKYRKRIENAPFVEKGYNDLTRDYNTTKQKYDETMNKLMGANVAKGIEEGHHGQRFEIKNYAYLPKKPYKPNRLSIILIGFVLASGVGLGFAALQEGMDNSIKTEKELNKLISVPVLTVISKVETQKEKSRRIFQRLVWVCVFFGVVLIGATILNQFVIPIDELWAVILTNAKNM